MYTLYLDTHNNKITIVLYYNGEIRVKNEITTNFDHSISTMPLIIESLNKADIDVDKLGEVLIVNGPGSFTGVRIGVTIAKTLAYTLNIPIKVFSSLLIKAVSINHNGDINIIEKEKNGVFLGTFDENNNLVNDYKYLTNKEYNELTDKETYIENIDIDFSKIIDYSKKIKPINPHIVNPLYVKKIEVQK
jgi:tRNA threonylcarbamoyladenosine biosynthesis protein TsaB